MTDITTAKWWARRDFYMKLIATAVFAMLVGIVSVSTLSTPAAAAENKKAETTQTKTESSYDYVAQPDDSYSLIARKAVQTYGLIFKVKLSHAQILFVETNLTKSAGQPMLVVGQKVSLKESMIKQWVEKAQKLTDKQEAAWSMYVQYADFNTNAVGEPRS